MNWWIRAGIERNLKYSSNKIYGLIKNRWFALRKRSDDSRTELISEVVWQLV